MAFKPFRKIRVDPSTPPTSKNVNDLQDNVGYALAQVLGKDQLDTSILSNITLQANIVNAIGHGLGRNLAGWIVIRNHGNAVPLTDLQDTNPSPSLLLYITVPQNCIVDLLIF